MMRSTIFPRFNRASPFVVSLLILAANAATANKHLMCWKAQDWVDKTEKFISAQDGPQYSGGFIYWQVDMCHPGQDRCYDVAMHVVCPWSEYIHRRNGCYVEGYLEELKREARRHLCESAKFFVTENLCTTTLCNRKFAVTTPAPLIINGTFCNETHCWNVTSCSPTPSVSPCWNGTAWLEEKCIMGICIWVPRDESATANPTTATATAATTGGGGGGLGGGSTPSPDGWGGPHIRYHHNNEHLGESRRSKWARVRNILIISFATCSLGLVACCCWMRGRWLLCCGLNDDDDNNNNENRNNNNSAGRRKRWRRSVVDRRFADDDDVMEEEQEELMKWDP